MTLSKFRGRCKGNQRRAFQACDLCHYAMFRAPYRIFTPVLACNWMKGAEKKEDAMVSHDYVFVALLIISAWVAVHWFGGGHIWKH